MMIFSILLYLLFVYCLSNCLINQGLNFKLLCSMKLDFLASCLLLFAFLFVPIETLPPMIDVECGSFFILLLIVLANYLQDKQRKDYIFIIFLAIIFSLFSLFIYFYGIPGHLLCIGTYSSPLIWSVLPKIAKAIYILIGILFVTFLFMQSNSQKMKETETPLLDTLQTLLYIAVFSAIFIPKLPFVPPPSFTSYLIAFWVGWAKILVISWAIKKKNRRTL